ncbi:T9SS type A sorting domain-containing protein [bacterium BMS3Abin03]|nr:T9SS type A sorting domain-containing protein [bacterium BMS3Abin03]
MIRRAMVVWLVVINSLFANKYFVNNTNGSDSNNGLTTNSAFETIQRALNYLSPGDTCLVQPGSYTGRVVIEQSGQQNSPITFIANGSGVVTQGFTINEANYIHIIGFEITNIPSSWNWNNRHGVTIFGSYNVIQDNYIHEIYWNGVRIDENGSFNSHDNLILNNTMYKCGECGIEVNGSNNTVQGNDISRTQEWNLSDGGDRDADGLRFSGHGHKIIGNYIHDIYISDPENGSAHVDCIQTWGPAYDIIFEKNIFSVNDVTTETQTAQLEDLNNPVYNLSFYNNIIKNCYRGFNTTSVEGCKWFNNSFINVANYPILLHDGCTGVKVYNNLFYNTGPMIMGNSSVSGFEKDYNAHYRSNSGNLQTLIIESKSQQPAPHELVNVNPLLTDVAGNNFEQSQNSPLNDAGYDLSSMGVNTDIRGLSRPQNNNFDIGAYEVNFVTSVGNEVAPDEFALQQNYPNPFNPTTTIGFTVPVDAYVTISVYNVIGEKVSEILNEEFTAGTNKVVFNADGLPSGIYFYKIDAIGKEGSHYTSIKKMTLIK